MLMRLILRILTSRISNKIVLPYLLLALLLAIAMTFVAVRLTTGALQDRMDNRLIEAHVSLGKIYVEKGDCLQAKNYAASAMEIDGENQDALALQRLSERCSK